MFSLSLQLLPERFYASNETFLSLQRQGGEIFLNVGSVTVTGVENGIIVMSSNSNRDSFFNFVFRILEKVWIHLSSAMVQIVKQTGFFSIDSVIRRGVHLKTRLCFVRSFYLRHTHRCYGGCTYGSPMTLIIYRSRSGDH